MALREGSPLPESTPGPLLDRLLYHDEKRRKDAQVSAAEASDPDGEAKVEGAGMGNALTFELLKVRTSSLPWRAAKLTRAWCRTSSLGFTQPQFWRWRPSSPIWMSSKSSRSSLLARSGSVGTMRCVRAGVEQGCRCRHRRGRG